MEDHTYPSVHSMHVHKVSTSMEPAARSTSERIRTLKAPLEPLQPRKTTTLTSNTRNLPSPTFFWTSWEWLHAICRVYSFVSGVFHSPSCLRDASMWLHIVLDGHMGCFQFGALRNSAASDILAHMSWFIGVPIYAGQTPKSEELDHGTGISWPWYLLPKSFPKLVWQLTFPHTVGEFPVAHLFANTYIVCLMVAILEGVLCYRTVVTGHLDSLFCELLAQLFRLTFCRAVCLCFY